MRSAARSDPAEPEAEPEAPYDDMVILVPVSCSIFFRLRPSFPMSLPTKLLCTRIFSGISSVLRETGRPGHRRRRS